MARAFTIERHHIELNYLEISLGLSCDTFDLLEDLEGKNYTIFIITNLKLYKKFFKKNKDKKFIIIHLSDERILWRNLFFYLKYRKNVKIYRNYLGDVIPFTMVVYDLFNLYKVLELNKVFYFLYHISLGFLTQIKLLFIKRFLKNTHHLPLGYTNNFIAYINSNSINLSLDKYNKLQWSGFRGYHGNLSRTLVLKTSKNMNLNFFFTNTWGGDLSQYTKDYVEDLLKGNLSLCPPGFRSNETYRFYESLFLGNLPVIYPVALNSFINPYPFSSVLFSQYKLFVKGLNCLNTSELKELILFYTKNLENIIEKIRLNITAQDRIS